MEINISSFQTSFIYLSSIDRPMLMLIYSTSIAFTIGGSLLESLSYRKCGMVFTDAAKVGLLQFVLKKVCKFV